MNPLPLWYRDRLKDIVSQYRNGATLEAIAQDWGLCPEYVRQLLVDAGVIEKRRR